MAVQGQCGLFVALTGGTSGPTSRNGGDCGVRASGYSWSLTCTSSCHSPCRGGAWLTSLELCLPRALVLCETCQPHQPLAGVYETGALTELGSRIEELTL
jgi:hypothetical protein